MSAKKGRHAIGASPSVLSKKPVKQGKSRKVPLPAAPESGVQLGKDFIAAAKKIADREARLSPSYEPGAAERRSATQYSINQLSDDQVQSIGSDYRNSAKPVREIAAEHHIHAGTIYTLAARYGWPKREAVTQVAQRISAVTPEIAQAALDRLATDAGAREIHDASEAMGALDSTTGPDFDRRSLSKAALVDQAGRDVLLESYATATAEVLAIHRELSSKALTSGQSLLAIFNAAIDDVREAYKHDARAAAKAVSQLAKEYNALLGSLQKAIDMQRQAYALDDMAGKGISLEHMQLMRAIRAGMVRPDQVSGLFLPPPQAGQGNDGQGTKGNPAPVIIDGTYEELVRAAEAQGVRLQ